jgi:hypothetical protein
MTWLLILSSRTVSQKISDFQTPRVARTEASPLTHAAARFPAVHGLGYKFIGRAPPARDGTTRRAPALS